MIRSLFIVALAVAMSGSCACKPKENCGEIIAPRDSVPREVIVLRDDLGPLRQAFNAASDRWRAVSLVSPTCTECIYGAEVVEREITSRYPTDRVATLMIWIPMLPTDNEPAGRASATIFAPNSAIQFYDADKEVGLAYTQHTFAGYFERARRSLPQSHRLTGAFADHEELIRPQWDLYMLYEPGVRWEVDAQPPMPARWIRHFGRREDRKTSTYWQDSPETGPREGDLHDAISEIAQTLHE